MKANLFMSIAAALLLLQSCSKTETASPQKITEGGKKTNAVWSIANVLQNNMVVQRDKPFKVWGTTPTGHTITVKASWNATTYTATVDGAGNWTASIPAAAANTTAQNIVVKDNGTTVKTITNVLIGEVWICAGQSNMYYPMAADPFFTNMTGVENSAAEIAAANFPRLRILKVPTNSQTTLQEQLGGTPAWVECSPSAIGSISAVSYYFGSNLLYYFSNNIPIGIVNSSVVNTSCQQWTKKETLQTVDGILGTTYATQSGSSVYYNGMIHPLRNLSIKGFVWYQGESNTTDVPLTRYYTLNTNMITNWRSMFGSSTLPFYITQLAPYFVWDDLGKFREQQAKIANDITNSGIAITMDLGMAPPDSPAWDIHPKYKKQAGSRLALLAAAKTYGYGFSYKGPQYSSFTQSGTQVTVNFVSGTATGLVSKDRNGNAVAISQCFQVAKADQVFQSATAVISGTQIILTVPAGFTVASVRYAFGAAYNTSLRNGSGLPMEPFRTDSW